MAEFARLDAASSKIVITQTHRPYHINPVDKVIFPLLDGQHPLHDIVEVVQAQIASGDLAIEGAENNDLGTIARECVHLALHTLCQAGMLIA